MEKQRTQFVNFPGVGSRKQYLNAHSHRNYLDSNIETKIYIIDPFRNIGFLLFTIIASF